MPKLDLNEKLQKHPITVVGSIIAATMLFCSSIGLYMHGLVLEQKNATIEYLREKLKGTTSSLIIEEKRGQVSY